MRLLFGVIGLLLVLAVIAFVARQQTRALVAGSPSVPAALTGPDGASRPLLVTTPEQARAVQEQVVQDVQRALQDAAAARASAEGQ